MRKGVAQVHRDVAIVRVLHERVQILHLPGADLAGFQMQVHGSGFRVAARLRERNVGWRHYARIVARRPRWTGYSASATIGSILVARRAGSTHARMATPAKTR